MERNRKTEKEPYIITTDPIITMQLADLETYKLTDLQTSYSQTYIFTDLHFLRLTFSQTYRLTYLKTFRLRYLKTFRLTDLRTNELTDGHSCPLKQLRCLKFD